MLAFSVTQVLSVEGCHILIVLTFDNKFLGWATLESQKNIPKEVANATISQIFLLLTKLNKENSEKVTENIEYFISLYPDSFNLVLKRVLVSVTAEIVLSKNKVEQKKDNTSKEKQFTPFAKLFRTLCTDFFEYNPDGAVLLSRLIVISDCQLLRVCHLEEFFDFVNFDSYERFLVTVATEKVISIDLKDPLSSPFIQDLAENYLSLLHTIASATAHVISAPSNTFKEEECKFSRILKAFLVSRVYSLAQKLVVVNEFLARIDKQSKEQRDAFKRTFEVINPFMQTIGEEKLQNSLRMIDSKKLLPDKILSTILDCQKPDMMTNAVSVLLSEVLYPGSQDLAKLGTGDVTALTPDSVPEATARGSQLRTIMKKLRYQPDWNLVFEQVASNFGSALKKHHSDTPVVTVASLSEFISALCNDTDLDIFLKAVSKSSNIPLMKLVLVNLHSLDPNVGGVDVLNMKLKPILKSNANDKNTLLYFESVSVLEVRIVALIQEQDMNDAVVTQLFNSDYKAAPEYIVLGCLVLLKDAGETAESRIILNVMQNFIVSMLDGDSKYLGAILSTFEEVNSQELSKLLVKYYNSRKSQDCIKKIASYTATFANDNVVVALLSTSSGFPEAFAVAVTFSQFGWNKFENFVTTQLDRSINVVATTIVNFMEKQATVEYESAQQGRQLSSSLKLETVFFLMTILGKQKLPREIAEKFRDLEALCLQAYPRLINFGQGHDEAILKNSRTNMFSVDVEKEMKRYYQKMYNKEIEIKDVIQMLQKLKDSDDPHDQDVFACMIHSLLDEYRFFAEYPVDALATTSVLFGNTIYFRLIEGPTLSIALRYILQSAREPPQSKMFKFAIQALFSFMKRLGEFPKFCSMLCQIPSLQSQPQLFEACQDSASGKTVSVGANDKSPAKEEDVKSDVVQSKFVSINAVDIGDDFPDQSTPPSEISDRILFMVNNIADSNIDARVDELKKKLCPEAFEWFANYLVVQRASIEPNNQYLYADMVLKFGSRLLLRFVFKSTIRQIITILNKLCGSEESSEHSELLSTRERSQLKNLGSWLGKITLQQNQPILRKFISFKDLLLEAYDQHVLVNVLPFVTKVLYSCKGSQIFAYPNPWLLGILRDMKEYYEIAELPLNSKFEIEVLFNTLEIKLEDINASGVLSSYKPGEVAQKFVRQKMMVSMARLSLNGEKPHMQQFPDTFSANTVQDIQSPVAGSQQPQPPQMDMLQQQQRILLAARHQQQQQQQQQQIQMQGAGATFENLKGTTIFVTHPNLRRLFQLSITKSIREILPAVVDRTVSVSLVTAKSLVLKDFALEVDEFKLRKAYINIVRRLAGALTLASCRDLVKESIQINITQYLQSLGQKLEANVMEQLPRAVEDNIAIPIAIIQNASMDKAVAELDDVMLPAIALRRQFRATRPDQQFCDTQYASRYALGLPEPLGIRPGGVSQKQFLLYDDLGKGGERIGTGSGSAGMFAGVAQDLLSQRSDQQKNEKLDSIMDANIRRKSPVVNDSPLVSTSISSPQDNYKRYILALQQLLDNVQQSALVVQKELPDAKSLQDIPSNSMPKVLALQALGLLTRVDNVDLCMKFAQMVMDILFNKERTSTSLVTECFVFLLDEVCSLSSVVARFVTGWLANAEDDRKYNKNVLEALIRAGMASLSDLDYMLAKGIEAQSKEKNDSRDIKKEKQSPVNHDKQKPSNVSATDFALEIIKELVGEKPVALRSDFLKTLKALDDVDDDRLSTVLDSSKPPVGISSLRDYFAYLFAEWVKLYKFSHDSTKMETQFISQLFDIGILNKPDRMVLFFSTAIEMAAAAFIKESDANKRSAMDTYSSVDALAKLIVDLLLIQEDASEKSKSKTEFLRSILSVFLLTFSHDHESSGPNFNERPYFRILSTFLCEWAEIRQTHFAEFVSNEEDARRLDQFSYQLYDTLAEFFLALQPAAFPGFTFAWMCLVSHRMFMPMLLEQGAESHSKKGSWEKAAALLVALLKFQSGYVIGRDIPEAITVIYKGTLRIFVVLLHDFPGFLAEYSFQLVSSMSQMFVQLRNVVLSATPENISVPDPLQSGFKADGLREITIDPIIAGHPEQLLIQTGIKKNVDIYIRVPSDHLLDQILPVLKLHTPTSESGIGYKVTHYDLKLLNSLVLYIGTNAVEEKPHNNVMFNSKSSEVTFLASLMKKEDTEFMFQVLQSMANNLGYPNSLTHWFSSVFLYFFSEKSSWQNHYNVQQVITRVLLERVICHKPHPWGVVVTFTQLLQDVDYKFFELPFIKGDREFERIFSALRTHFSMNVQD